MATIMTCLLSASAAYAQEKYTISMPTRNDKNCEPIQIEKLGIQTTVIGGLSATELDITFYNPNKRRLEGTFEIPLAPGWQIAQFALDIDGKMREAVTVPKAKGREAFNAITRRRIDPALVEHVAGNLFRARVYPFEPMSRRRVIITLDHALQQNGNIDLFDFPYTFQEKIKEFSLSIRVVERPTSGAKVEGLPGLSFAQRRAESVLNHEAKQITLTERIKVHLPRENNLKLLFAQDSEGLIYAAPAPYRIGQKNIAKPKSISILWDASHSRRKANLKKEMELLRGYIEWMGEGKVELIPFGIACDKPRAFTIKNKKCDALFNALEQIQLDGATDLSKIQWKQLSGERIFLFSDGITTMPGVQSIIPKEKLLYCISSSPVHNEHWFKAVAVASGGELINLTELSIQEAQKQLTHQTPTILSWQPAQGKSYSFPQKQSAKPPLWLIGEAKKEFSTLEIKIQEAESRKGQETIKAENPIVWKDKDIAGLLRRAFVRQEIARLMSENQADEAELLAQKHHVVTEQSSLIVLEQLSDYVEYRITPPAELQDKYFEQIERLNKDSIEEAKERLEQLVKRSKEQTEWWEGKRPTPKHKKGDFRVRGLGSLRRSSNTGQVNAAEAEPTAQAYGYRSPDQDGAGLDEIQEDYDTTKSAGDAPISGSIQIEAWDSQSPYLKVLEYAEPGTQEKTYFKLKKEYGDIPSFYLDAAAFFHKKGEKDLAYRIATNLLEVEYESPELMRALARFLEEMQQLDLAEAIYRHLTEIAPHEPQSFRDLALLLEQRGQLQEAIDLLYKVATAKWEERFNGVDLIALNELNAIRMRNPKAALKLNAIDKRLIKNEPVDVRIVLSWANDNADVDLHVTPPCGEECFYGNRYTQSNAKISNDITRGYGPEEFMHRKGMKGAYTIKANLFSNNSQTSIVPKYVYVKCYLYYGTPREEVKELSFRIEEVKDVVTIGKIEFQ